MRIQLKKRMAGLGLFGVLSLFLFSCQQTIEADIAIVNGQVYNGIDTKEQKSTILITGDKITFVGDGTRKKIKAKQTIDATGFVVSPGFIDPHTHADRDLKEEDTKLNLPFMFQGITTVVVGNDGDSFYPMHEYNNRYEKQGIGTNVMQMTGHGTLREKVMGKSDRLAKPEEIKEMQNLLREEMQNGSWGLSTGLYYSPGSYSNTEEVIELAKVAQEYGGIYDTHLRDESSYTIGLLASIQEALDIGEATKIPIHISHIKCLGVDVWEQSDSIIKMVEKARANGIEVTANQYPYDASATGLKAAVIPRWAESGGIDSLFYRLTTPEKSKVVEGVEKNIKRRGGAEKLLIVKSEDQNFVGKTLKQIAKELDVSEPEAVFIILKKGYARVASFNMTDHDILNFMKQDWVVTGSDGNTGHPRKYGSFPRKFDLYVKDKKVMSLGQFIVNSSAKTAKIFGLKNRGSLTKGSFADIIIFNPETFKDVADYKDSFQLSQGLEYSIINGQIVINRGKYADTLPGRVLKNNSQ